MTQTRPLVLVEWVDACSHTNKGWNALDEVVDLGLQTVSSVGWLVHKDTDRLVVIASKDGDGNVSGDVTIPSSWVAKITYLEPRNGKQKCSQGRRTR